MGLNLASEGVELDNKPLDAVIEFGPRWSDGAAATLPHAEPLLL